jgi:hypothetical protein
VAARSVVTRNVEPYAIVAGCPAEPIAFRFSRGTIERLLRVRWWTWDDEKIRAAVPLLSAAKMDEFLELYDAAGNAADQ